MRRASLIIAALLLVGCKNGTIDMPGVGIGTDGRLTSDVYTWDCSSEDGAWMGVFKFDVTLEWVPDEVMSRELPAPGTCVSDLNLFAIDDQMQGEVIPNAETNPAWRTAVDKGRMQEVWTGLWRDDVSGDYMGCGPVSDIIVDGIEVYDAGILNGASTPQAGNVALVEINDMSTGDFEDGFEFGEQLEVSWESNGWDESFVQIRRVRNWIAWETVTCNTTGATDITIDDDVWSMLSEELSVDYNYLYVGFRNTDEWEAEDGQVIDVVTRALHVAGVLDLEDA